ncbi:hypothetical protein H8959_008535 [Pygathrix nigripes]
MCSGVACLGGRRLGRAEMSSPRFSGLLAKGSNEDDQVVNLSKVTRRRQAGTESGKTRRDRSPEGVGLPRTECRPPRPGNCLLPGRQARRSPRRY